MACSETLLCFQGLEPADAADVVGTQHWVSEHRGPAGIARYYGLATRSRHKDGRDGRVTVRMRAVLLLNSSCFTCTDSSDTEIASGTDTEDVESFMPNVVSLLCR
jgi:hypothetical protein